MNPEPSVEPISVVIAARDEERVIGRCLGSLLDGARPGELDVVVVVNGSTDRTAEIASSFGPPVRVVTTPRASKTHAYNLGDEAARSFPRFYLDADVELSSDAVRAVAEELRATRALAAAPRLHIVMTESSWAVRAYYAIWSRLPYVVDNLVGSGVFALSREGRDRFGRFPEIIADDRYVRGLFPSGERVSVASHEFVVHAPLRAADLIRRKTRVVAGNEQYRRRYMPGWRTRLRRAEGRLDLVLLHHPTLVPHAAVYLAIGALARLRALWKAVTGTGTTWERDESSRLMSVPVAVPAAPSGSRPAGSTPSGPTSPGPPAATVPGGDGHPAP